MIAAAGFVGLTTLPVLLQQIGGEPGNLTLIVEFLSATPRGEHGWGESLELVLQGGTDWMVVLWPHGNLDPTRAGEQFLVAALLALGSLLNARESDQPRRLWIGSVWLALLLSVAAAYLVKGRLEPYLLHFTYGLFGMLFAFLALAIRRSLPDRFLLRRGVREAPLCLLAAALVAAVVLRPLPEAPADDRPARFLAGLDLDTDTPVLIEPAEGDDGRRLWIEGAGLLLQLERAGYRVRASRRWDDLYTSDRLERPGEPVQRILLSRRRPAGVRTWVDLGEFGAARR